MRTAGNVLAWLAGTAVVAALRRGVVVIDFRPKLDGERVDELREPRTPWSRSA